MSLNEKTYRRCIEMERKREWKYRQTKQGAFEARILSTDVAPQGYDILRDRYLSDHGRNVNRMLRMLDAAGSLRYSPTPRKNWGRRWGVLTSADLRPAINRARMKIQRQAPECLDTFWAVLRNGEDRSKSLWELAKKWYGEKLSKLQS